MINNPKNLAYRNFFVVGIFWGLVYIPYKVSLKKIRATKQESSYNSGAKSRVLFTRPYKK